MADHRPWIKLWKAYAADPGIKRLGLEGEARWIRLLLFVAEHGTEGAWTGPLRNLVSAMAFTGRGELPRQRAGRFLARLPGVTVTASDVTRMSPKGHHDVVPGDVSVTSVGDINSVTSGHQENIFGDNIRVTVTFRNWNKYQDSKGAERMRRSRAKRHSDGPTPSHDVTSPASQAQPNRAQSRSRLDKNPLTPLRVGSTTATPPTHIPTYPEPEPGAHKVAMQSLKEVLDKAKPIPPPEPRKAYVPKHPPHYQPDKHPTDDPVNQPNDDPWA